MLYNASRDKGAAWIAFLAGASLCQIPQDIQAPGFFDKAMQMSPVSSSADCWVAGKAGTGYVAYTLGGSISIDLSGDRRSYRLVFIDPSSGLALGKTTRVKGGNPLTLKTPAEEAVAYLY